MLAIGALLLTPAVALPASLQPLQRSRSSKNKKVDFSGDWMSTRGPIALKQKGDKVSGRYGYGAKSEVQGKVEGRRFTFEYKGSAGRGEGWFELWEDGTGMIGDTLSSEGKAGKWGAYRKLAVQAKPDKGKIVTGQTKSGLNYHLRVPRSYSKNKKYPAIAFFHGSNMTSADYVYTIASVWRKIADDYIIVGFDGENLATFSTQEKRAYNFSYVNFSGHEKGPEWVHRQSPALVAEGLEELEGQLPIERWFAGGHSQGGFLTYAVMMFYPERLAGAFPMSCSLLVQCEPDSFDDKEQRAAQRLVPIAVVHGTTDPVVDFSSGLYCYQRMQDGGFPALRLFEDKHAGHMFAHLPVDEAVLWLEEMSSGDASNLLKHAEASFKSKDYRDAIAASARASSLDRKGAFKKRIDRLGDKLDKVADERAETLEKAMAKNADGAWVDDFLEFRREFAFSARASKCMKLYEKLRAKHAQKAQTLFYKARNENDPVKRRALREELVEKYYASKWYRLVKGWLTD